MPVGNYVFINDCLGAIGAEACYSNMHCSCYSEKRCVLGKRILIWSLIVENLWYGE